MPNGFDFSLDETGELNIIQDIHDIKTVEDNDLRVEMAYNRIKSVAKNWFIDEIGADIEVLIGRACSKKNAEMGKRLIIQALVFDQLWNEDDIYIKSEIKDNVHIVYSIYLKMYQSETEETISTEIIAELDLIKGVHIRYGWEPRN